MILFAKRFDLSTLSLLQMYIVSNEFTVVHNMDVLVCVVYGQGVCGFNSLKQSFIGSNNNGILIYFSQCSLFKKEGAT